MYGTEKKMPYEKIHRYRFTEEEDRKLKYLVRKLGTNNWYEVATRIPQRTARQCRDRWNHYISPNANNSEWTEVEDQHIIQYLKKYGKQWTKIAQHLPGRTPIGVRNRSCLLSRKDETDPFLRTLLKDEYIKKSEREKKKEKKTNQQTEEKPILPPCHELFVLANIPMSMQLGIAFDFNSNESITV